MGSLVQYFEKIGPGDVAQVDAWTHNDGRFGADSLMVRVRVHYKYSSRQELHRGKGYEDLRKRARVIASELIAEALRKEARTSPSRKRARRDPAMKPTIYEALQRRLGRKPTNAELKAEVQRILSEGHAQAAQQGKLPWQRARRRGRRDPSRRLPLIDRSGVEAVPADARAKALAFAITHYRALRDSGSGPQQAKRKTWQALQNASYGMGSRFGYFIRYAHHIEEIVAAAQSQVDASRPRRRRR